MYIKIYRFNILFANEFNSLLVTLFILKFLIIFDFSFYNLRYMLGHNGPLTNFQSVVSNLYFLLGFQLSIIFFGSLLFNPVIKGLKKLLSS